jgi:hypothetical protein
MDLALLLSQNPLAAASGLAGLCLAATWPLLRRRRPILLAQATAGLLFGAHYALIGAFSGAAMNMILSSQALLALPLGLSPRFRAVYLASLPLVAAGVVLTWAGWPSVFAAAGAVFVSLARYQTGVRHLRCGVAAALPCWFGHNWLVGSVPAMTADAVSMSLNLWRLWRDRPGGSLTAGPDSDAREGLAGAGPRL